MTRPEQITDENGVTRVSLSGKEMFSFSAKLEQEKKHVTVSISGAISSAVSLSLFDELNNYAAFCYSITLELSGITHIHSDVFYYLRELSEDLDSSGCFLRLASCSDCVLAELDANGLAECFELT